MSYRYDGLRRCQRCGSYMPSNWERCGRCGCPIKGRHTSRRVWAFLILLAFVTFVFRAQIIQIFQNYSRKDYGNISADEGIGIITPSDRVPKQSPHISYPDSSHEKGSDSVNPVYDGEKANDSSGLEDPEPSEQELAREQFYDLIRDAMKNAEEQITLPVPGTSYDARIVFGIITEIVRDDPEIMFYKGGSYRADGRLTLQYHKSRDFILDAVSKTLEKADAVLEEIIVPGMSNFEKELAIHDYIVNNCRYDIENLERDTIPPQAHNAYGVLINGVAVCEGYAKAMKLLLDRVNVPNFIASGSSKGQSHAWNIVYLDGQYYHVDATWDDPVMSDGEQILTHTYFNLPDNEIQKDHDWEKGKYPECHDTAYNFYHYYGLTAASLDEVTNILGEAMNNGSSRASFRMTDFSNDRYDELIERATNVLGLGRIVYSVNELYGVVDLWMTP